MIKPTGVHVYSEITGLKQVLLHRPGKEIDNLTPTNKDRLLFDDLPDAHLAGVEHDAFADALRSCGVETIYIEQLLADVLEVPELRTNFVREFLEEDAIAAPNIPPLTEWLTNITDSQELADLLVAGIRNVSDDIPVKLPQPPPAEQLMLLDPLPNLYFSRDAFSFIGRGVSLSRMYTNARQRETLIGEYLFNYHPDFAGLPRYYERTYPYSLEGGDILVLNEHVLAVGISERTKIQAIELLAKNLLNEETGYQYILAMKIPTKRAFMHLDTVFTMIDSNVFTIHPEIEDALEIYEFSRQGKEIGSRLKRGELSQILAGYLAVDQVKLIQCGGGDPIDAQREQWNDGSNTLAIAPGKVIVYSRNHVTNRILEEAGIQLLRISSSELSRGRGGPRCMSMPMRRD